MVSAVVAVFLVHVVLAMATSVAAAFGFKAVLFPLAAPVGLLIAHNAVIARLEKGDWSYVSLDRSAADPRRLAAATVIGAAAVGVPCAILLATGQLTLFSAADGSSLATTGYLLWLFVPAALAEELLARGYLFSVLREVWGWRPALLVTSAGFGLLHLQNPGSNPQAIINVILAGFFLGVVLIRYASLYAAWAAHAAWNLVLAAALHADVSGLEMAGLPDYRLAETGPDWLTGGVWGPEGGAAAAAGLAVASVLLVRPLLGRLRPSTSTTDSST